MPQIHLIDVTMRDGHQCLWSTRMTNAMIAPVLDLADDAGFHTIDLVGGAVFDVCVRYLQENPWARMRMAARRLRRTPINVWMRGASLFTFEYFPHDVVELTIAHLAANGVHHLTTYDALNDNRNLASSSHSGSNGSASRIRADCSRQNAYERLRPRYSRPRPASRSSCIRTACRASHRRCTATRWTPA